MLPSTRIISRYGRLLAFSAIAFSGPATRPALSSNPINNTLLGLPSDATTKASNKTDYLLVKPFFVASYNSDAGEPNWVSWVLTKDDLGDAPRKRTFDTDTTLPIGFKRIKTKEYANSGFDRGHMCPHSDRAASPEEADSTFIMTNIIPQAPNVNRKAWEQLEEYERRLAEQGNHIYISSGPAGLGGVGSNGPANWISENRVAVPAECWKILVVVPADGGDDDLKKIDKETRVIAVIMPNDDAKVGLEWKQYRVSVAAIEKETGLHFFRALPADLQKELKEKVDARPTPKPVPRDYGGKTDGG